MRIGLISGEYPPQPGGVGDYSARLVAEWASRGHQVHVLARSIAQESRDSVVMHNVVPGWGLPVLALIRVWAQQNRLDLINLQYQTAIYDMSGWMHFVPRAAPVPVVTTFHDLLVPYLFPRAGRLREWIVMHLARHSAAAVTTNGEDYARFAALPQRHQIPIGSNISVEPFTEVERDALRASVLQPGEALLLHFGFLYPNRGVEDLLAALQRVLDDGLRARLVIVGGREGGPASAEYVSALDATVDALGLREAVHWTGYVPKDEVSRWLQAADWVVLPFRDGASYRRGSLIAAIMHGCGIMTTRPAAATPDFADGEQVLFFPAGDVPVLADLLRASLTDAGLRDRLRQNVRAIRDGFEWQGIAERFLDLFQRVQRV